MVASRRCGRASGDAASRASRPRSEMQSIAGRLAPTPRTAGELQADHVAAVANATATQRWWQVMLGPGERDLQQRCAVRAIRGHGVDAVADEHDPARDRLCARRTPSIAGLWVRDAQARLSGRRCRLHVHWDGDRAGHDLVEAAPEDGVGAFTRFVHSQRGERVRRCGPRSAARPGARGTTSASSPGVGGGESPVVAAAADLQRRGGWAGVAGTVSANATVRLPAGYLVGGQPGAQRQRLAGGGRDAGARIDWHPDGAVSRSSASSCSRRGRTATSAFIWDW